MTQKRYTEIPKRQKCINKEEPYIGGAEDIVDDALGKPQSEVNQERIKDIAAEVQRAQGAESALDGKIGTEKTRAEGVEGGLNTRLQTLEQLATISVSGGDIGIGTAADFESDDPEDLAKIPTIGAMLGIIDDEPAAGSNNLVKSNGVAVTKADAVYSKNLYNPNRVLDGYFFWNYDDNTPQQDANYCISDYIPVSGDVTLNKTTASGTGHRVYDKNGNIIAYFTTSQYTYNASRGDAFVRFSIKKSWSNIQIESGTTSTSYVPWTDKNDVVELLNQNVESLSNRISANENGIYNINSQLNALIYSNTVTAETTVSTGIKLQQGKTYLIKNLSASGSIVVYNHYNDSDHSVGTLNSGRSLTYNCNNDGEVYIYTNIANVNVSVFEKSVGFQVEKNTTDISTINNEIYDINSLLAPIIYAENVTAESTVATGIKLKQDSSYVIKNQASNGAIVVYNNYGGSNHQVGVLNAGVSLTYNCSNDGEVYVYTSVANVNISVYKKALGYQVDKNTKDIQAINDKINNTKTVKTDGSGDFTTILDAALYAKAHPNTNLIIRVFAGTYDIIQEFEDKYGATYFSAMTEGEYGIPIGFGETWEFAAGAKIEAIYSGDNYDVVTKSFSVFFTAQGQGYYDFTLIGANIKAQNVKYCVHDENVNSEIPYTHTYKNCQMKIIQDGSSSWAEPWYALRCIGGGLGKSGNIIIDGCYFDGENEYTNDILVSYHNSSATDAMSFIKVANSYFNGNKTLYVSYFGTSANITKCIITNNSVGKAPYKKAENASAQVDNVELLAWNNIVRA